MDAYITENDMLARFGEPEMELLATIGDDVIARALQDASEEAESYVAVNYTPPLPNIPAPLKAATCDIARYRLYKDRATEQVKERYEQAIKWLVRLAEGKVKLTFSPALTQEQAETTLTPAVAPAVASASGGVFGDAAFGRMLGAAPDIQPTDIWST